MRERVSDEWCDAEIMILKHVTSRLGPAVHWQAEANAGERCRLGTARAGLRRSASNCSVTSDEGCAESSDWSRLASSAQERKALAKAVGAIENRQMAWFSVQWRRGCASSRHRPGWDVARARISGCCSPCPNASRHRWQSIAVPYGMRQQATCRRPLALDRTGLYNRPRRRSDPLR